MHICISPHKPSELISGACLPRQGRPFFFTYSLLPWHFFALNSAPKWQRNAPKKRPKMATLGAAKRADDLLATIVFSARRLEGLFLVGFPQS